MQKSVAGIILAATLSLVVVFSGCGGSSYGGGGGTGGGNGVGAPVNIDLEPQPQVSLDQGDTAQMGVRILDANNHQIFTLSPTFHTSNAAVATIANNGLVCAGTWDSLSTPIVCTPGPVGTATITATAANLTSDAVTVYVHNHITKITVTPADADPCKTVNASAGAAHAKNYTATAFNASNTDITGTVGNFFWQVQSPSVATLLTSANGLPANQAQLQAAVPGSTDLTANVSNVTGSLTSSAFPTFVACSPASIVLRAPGPSTSFSEAVAASTTMTKTVIDTLGFDISGITLTISSSWPGVIQRGNLTAAGAAPGTTGFVASCTPPFCNINLNGPVYSDIVVGNVTGAAGATRLYISSTQFPTAPEGNPAAQLIPVDLTASGGTAVPASPITLPHVPNSMMTNIEGNTLYMGSASGLMVMDENANSINTVTNAPGKLLAVSRLGGQAVVADSATNKVYIFNASGSTVTTLNIPFDATFMSASFSVDDFHVYITSGSTVYVASPLESLHTFGSGVGSVISTDFLANGSFAYMASGTANSVAVGASCDFSLVSSATTTSTPQLIAQAWNGSAMVVVNQTGIDKLVTPIVPGPCHPTEPSNADTFIDFGLGAFTAHQMLVAPDSSRVYVAPAGINKVLTADLNANTAGSIQLTGTATEPLAIGILQAGNEAYALTAGDKALHILNVALQHDDGTVSISFPACSACTPNLMAVRPH
jgi:hypothetical protein